MSSRVLVVRDAERLECGFWGCKASLRCQSSRGEIRLYRSSDFRLAEMVRGWSGSEKDVAG